MLTLAVVEEILGATLPVPTCVPPLWGTVVQADWQVQPTAKAARLQMVLGARASDRPGLVTIDYEAGERPVVEPERLDPWHLVFESSAEGVVLLCTLDRRCLMEEAVAFVDGIGGEEVRLLSHETLEEARRHGVRSDGRDAPGGRWASDDPAVWFDERGSRVAEASIDASMWQPHRRGLDEIQRDIGVQVPLLSSWPRQLGLLTETRYQPSVRPLRAGDAVQLLSVLWCFQGHRGGGHPHLRVSVAFSLDNDGVVAADLDRIGRWRLRSMRSQPILDVDHWSELRLGLRLSD